MATVFVFFFLRCLICVSLYGSLIIAGDTKPKTWRVSIYVALALNGTAGFGYLLPTFIPYADLWGLIGNTIMLVGVFFSYYRAVPMENIAVRKTLARELGLIMGFATALAVFVSISAGKRDELRVQESFSAVVYALSDEVRDLRKAVNRLTRKVDSIEKQTGRADSVARHKPLKR